MKEKFSEKEIKLIRLLADDNSVSGIAEKEKVKRRGLEGVMVRVRLKTGLKTIGGVVAHFFRNGLID